MEKRVIFAIIISFIFIAIYNSFFMDKYQTSEKSVEYTEVPVVTDTTVIETAAAPVFLNSEQNKKSEISAKQTNVVSMAQIPHEKIEKSEPETIIKKTENYTLEFSTIGASVSKIFLNKFNVISKPDTLNLINSEFTVLSENILTADIDANGELSKANFKMVSNADTQIKFEYQTSGYYYYYDNIIQSDLPPNLKITKIYTIDDLSYLIKLDIIIEKPETLELTRLQLIQINSNESAEKYTGGLIINWRCGLFIEHNKPNNFVYFLNESFEKVSAGEGKLEPEFDNAVYRKVIPIPEAGWFGINSNYFLSAVSPRNIKSNAVNLFSTKTNIGFQYLSVPLTFDNNIISAGIDMFVGPKEYYLLKNAIPDAGLEKTMDYGWFEALVLILLKILKFFYSFTFNYGIAIILLTVLLNIIMYPLKAKSMRAMEEMKKLQPKMQELKEKFGDDKMKIQQETMRIYKEHKINPLGGCLPMLLQLPIFIGLYRMLEYAIELRGAQFLYIKDLSAADPTYVLPLLMGASMFIQQKMTPVPPEQQKTMMFLPIIFTFMFLNMPAGLIIYWTSFNIISILQQVYQTKFSSKKKQIKGVV